MHEREHHLRSKNSNALVSSSAVSTSFSSLLSVLLIAIFYHRWAQFGEYKYLPPQRWLHNIEHGAIVFLYHPCANQNIVDKLRTIVKNCLYRHIITPYKLLSPERPFALAAWGATIEFSVLDSTTVIDFIKQHAKKAPEKVSRDGQYKQLLTEHAKIITSEDDFILCPNAKASMM